MPLTPFPNRFFALLVALLALTAGASAFFEERADHSVAFKRSLPGYTYVFPKDHGSHDDFRTEWWYYTGHVTSADGRRFGYQLTFFRRAIDHPEPQLNPSRWAIRHLYLAHAALSDLSAGRYTYGEKLSRAGLGKAGAETGGLRVWIDRWTAVATSPDHAEHHLTASTDQFELDLKVQPEKPPVIHGIEGVSRKGNAGEQASHYYSLTRLATMGTVTVEGKAYSVKGTSWMDHEFGSSDLGEGLIGWDWFSVQLNNRTELMLYLLRNATGLPDPASSGTMVLPDGGVQHLALSDFHVETEGHWTSLTSGVRYPSRWRITVPGQRTTLELTPLLSDQELRTHRSTQVTYWEGAVDLHGRMGDAPVNGQGYVELTGYGERFRQKL